jgi:hypothetical protein
MRVSDAVRAPRGAVRPTWWGALATCLLLGLLLPDGALGSFEVSKWEAGTCKQSSCSDAGPDEAFYTQAAGHPNFGITDFAFTYKESGVLVKAKEPEDNVQDVRVDLPPGLAVDPEVTEKCTESQLDEFKCPPGSKVGEDQATGTAELLAGQKTTVEESFPVYNMERKPGEPARFGVEVNSSTLKTAESLLGHHLTGELYLEGGISWYHEPETSENSGVASGDFHEFFKIQNIPTEPEVVESRLIFWGVPQEHTGVGSPMAFLTLPSTCSNRPITRLHVDSHQHPGHFLAYENQTPVTATGCGQLPFAPSLSLSAGSAIADQPDGASVALHIPQATNEPSKTGSPDLLSTEVTLPEGMTLNPSAAHGLEACTDAEIGLGTNAKVSCPEGSKIGTVEINAPGIPDGSLNGSLYLATPETGQGPESGKEFRVFLAAEAPAYDVGLRLEGQVRANVHTGRLSAVFAGTPQVPFEDFKIQFNGGSRAPLANPLGCGTAAPAATITPYTGQPATVAATHGFVVETGGGNCSAPPFSLVQSIPAQSPPQAGAYSPFTFNLTRGDGQQYPSQIETTLPPGLLGAIPSVPLCDEAQAQAGSCPSASQIGTVAVAAGAGPEPFAFTGTAYLTGPYNGAPYGLSIVVPAVAGPYNLGDVITRAGLTVGLYDARVTVTATLPTIVEGIPLRLKSLSVAVNRPNFLFNPTSCSPMATESLLTSTAGSTQSLSSPFQVNGCSTLPFKPKLVAHTSAKASKRDGASLEVKVTQTPHQADIRELQMTLPKVLPDRLATLNGACPAASFEAALPPGSCATAARVGNVTVNTPVLSGPLRGPAYLISHGGAGFPDLDLILQGDGIEVVLVGHNYISPAGIITSTFESLPDVPISSVDVQLPLEENSALSANGSLCAAKAKSLLAPTTILAQTGAKITQSTHITVVGCPVTVLSHKIKGNKAILEVKVPSSGRLSVNGQYLRGRTRKLAKASIVTLTVPLTAHGVTAVRRHRGHLRVKLRLRFTPASASAGAPEASSLTLAYR